MVTSASPLTTKLFTRTLVEELLQRALGRLADSEFLRTLLRILTDTAIISAESTAETLDVSVLIGPTHPTLQRLLTSHTPTIVGINETTRNLIRNALLRILADGGGLDEQVRAIRRIFTTASRKRAVTISRTESAIFWNGGGHMQMVAAGAITHIWITSRDNRVRESHEPMDGQCQPIEAKFVTGAGVHLAFPADPDGPPEEIIQCRCVEAPGVRPCDTRGAWLASDAGRSAYWKGEIARVEERERVTLRALRQLFADQRRDVLAVASQMMGLS